MEEAETEAEEEAAEDEEEENKGDDGKEEEEENPKDDINGASGPQAERLKAEDGESKVKTRAREDATRFDSRPEMEEETVREST